MDDVCRFPFVRALSACAEGEMGTAMSGAGLGGEGEGEPRGECWAGDISKDAMGTGYRVRVCRLAPLYS